MGLFRSGLLACLVVGSATFAQQGTPPNPNPGVPTPTPGVPDTTAPIPAPIVPEPAPTPGVDPNALQPAPVTPPDLTTPPPGVSNAPAKPKKPAVPALPTLRGTVGTIDKNAMTITIHGKSKDETLNVTSKTRIFADGKPAILADAKEGEHVVAEYHTNKEKAKDALTLRFGGAAVPEHKAEAKPVVKKTSKSKANAKKKSKKTPANENTTPTPLPGPDNTTVTPLPGTPEPAVPAPIPGTPTPNPGNPGIPAPAPGTPGNP
jgi:hypothetical protein